MAVLKIVQKETKGIVTITSHTQYNNIKADKVIFDENITARLYGSIKETVTLKKGSKLYLHGTLHGSIENEGGEIIIFK